MGETIDPDRIIDVVEQTSSGAHAWRRQRRIPFLAVFALLLVAALPGRPAIQTPSNAARQNALTFEQQGRLAEAEAAWQDDLKARPQNPEPYAHLGLLKARQERYAEAVPLYRKALDIDPKLTGLRINLGLALFKGGQMQEAIPEFAAALKAVPAHSLDAQRLTILLGMAHYGIAQYREATPFLMEAATADPQNLPLRLALAHSCLWSHQVQCVMDTYHEILQLNAESAEADMIAGEALDEMKDQDGAIKMFRAAVKANPREPNAHFGLGYLLWTQKIYPEAASEFKAELDNDADHLQSRLYLADSYLQLNQTEEALQLLEKVAREDPSQELAHLDLGILYGDAHRNDEALRELTLAEKLKPSDINVHWRLGRLYRALGRKEEAKVELDKASRLNKAVDEDLANKIANGRAKPPETPPAAAPAPNQ